MCKRKILMLVQGLKLAGLENVVYNIARNIKNSGKYDVEVCCYDTLGFYSGILKNENIPVHFLPRKKGVDWLYPLRLKTIICSRNIDLIHSHNATAWFYAGLTAFMHKVLIVYTEHDRAFPSPGRIAFLNKFLSKITNQIVAVSEEVKNNLRLYEGIKNVDVIYNAVDENKFRPLTYEEKKIRRKKYGFDENGILLGSVGRLDALKNQGLIIKALGQLGNDVNSIKFLIIGDGENRENLKSEAKSLGLSDRVVFMGERTDVADILPTIDIFILPSFTEGMPVAIIEAMACGLPVIASRIGGIPELIKSEESGTLITPDNLDELVSALKNLIKNEDQRLQMGRFNRKSAEKDFSLKGVTEKYIDVYDSCLRK